MLVRGDLEVMLAGIQCKVFIYQMQKLVTSLFITQCSLTSATHNWIEAALDQWDMYKHVLPY